MGLSQWFAQNWFEVFQTAGIIASVLFATQSMRAGTRAQRVSNHIALTQGHREIWMEHSRRPELHRVLDETADPKSNPVTRNEEIFVNQVILQMCTVFYAQASNLVFELEGLRRDIRWILSLPIPNSVWQKTKIVQNSMFVAFVESSLNEATPAKEGVHL